MKVQFTPSLGLAVLVALAGCATAPRVYESELDRMPLTTKIEPQDIRRTVEKMAESLIADPGVLDATKGERPILDIEPMKNRSQMEGLSSECHILTFLPISIRQYH